MRGAAVALLLALAVVVLADPGRLVRHEGATASAGRRAVGRPPGVLWLRWRLGRMLRSGSGSGSGSGSESVEELPLFVRQMAGLLRAGRPPSVLWADLDAVYAEEDTGFAARARPVISAARRASALGLSVPEALSDALGPAPRDVTGGLLSEAVGRLWGDLAACLAVAERSGAPLATILDHYAAQLESEFAGRAARETALAGPRATVVLLTWLPVVGLLLGFALGVDPVQVLSTDPFGRSAFCVGVILMIVARSWSGRLVRRAESAS
ncbi:type II secretion system F family protein [Arthrobacter bussei]|nr:type II secretion system F family protein [Arthrobacter bussei]